MGRAAPVSFYGPEGDAFAPSSWTKGTVLNYYQHNIGDYRRDTAHLSLLEHGIYRQLMDAYYLSERPIPNETELVIRRLAAKTEDERNAVIAVLNEFFKPSKKGYVHTRCEVEIARYVAKVETAKANGIKGGRPPKTYSVISGNQKKPDRKLTNNHKPITNNQSKNILPDWIPENAWQGFLEMRRKSKSDPTERAKALIVGELGKLRDAGGDVAAILDQSTANGWKGVFPLKTNGANHAGAGKYHPIKASREALARELAKENMGGAASPQVFDALPDEVHGEFS